MPGIINKIKIKNPKSKEIKITNDKSIEFKGKIWTKKKEEKDSTNRRNMGGGEVRSGGWNGVKIKKMTLLKKDDQGWLQIILIIPIANQGRSFFKVARENEGRSQ